MVRSLRYPIQLVVSFLLSGFPTALVAQGTTLIRNVTVIDGTGQPARPGLDVLFDGVRIAAVRPTGSPASARSIIDGTGKFLVPGFIDTHVHAAAGPFLIDSSGPRPRARLQYDETVATEILAALLRFGVTTTRIPGGPTEP